MRKNEEVKQQERKERKKPMRREGKGREGNGKARCVRKRQVDEVMMKKEGGREQLPKEI